MAGESLIIGRCKHATGGNDEALELIASSLNLAELHHLPGLIWQAHTAMAGLVSSRTIPPDLGAFHRDLALHAVQEVADTFGDSARAEAFRRAARARARVISTS